MKVFDFGFKRVKENGKAMTKFDVAYTIESYGVSYTDRFITHIMEIYSYDELKTRLKSVLAQAVALGNSDLKVIA